MTRVDKLSGKFCIQHKDTACKPRSRIPATHEPLPLYRGLCPRVHHLSCDVVLAVDLTCLLANPEKQEASRIAKGIATPSVG